MLRSSSCWENPFRWSMLICAVTASHLPQRRNGTEVSRSRLFLPQLRGTIIPKPEKWNPNTSVHRWPSGKIDDPGKWNKPHPNQCPPFLSKPTNKDTYSSAFSFPGFTGSRIKTPPGKGARPSSTMEIMEMPRRCGGLAIPISRSVSLPEWIGQRTSERFVWLWVKTPMVYPVNIPIPTKISTIGGEFTYQNGTIGVDPRRFTTKLMVFPNSLKPRELGRSAVKHVGELTGRFDFWVGTLQERMRT